MITISTYWAITIILWVIILYCWYLIEFKDLELGALILMIICVVCFWTWIIYIQLLT